METRRYFPRVNYHWQFTTPRLQDKRWYDPIIYDGVVWPCLPDLASKFCLTFSHWHPFQSRLPARTSLPLGRRGPQSSMDWNPGHLTWNSPETMRSNLDFGGSSKLQGFARPFQVFKFTKQIKAAQGYCTSRQLLPCYLSIVANASCILATMKLMPMTEQWTFSHTDTYSIF